MICKARPRLNKLLPALFLLFTAACGSDTGVDVECFNCTPCDKAAAAGGVFCLTYRMATASYLAPADPGQISMLTESEQQLMAPRVKSAEVEQIIKKGGEVEALINFIPYQGLPEYPENRLAGQQAEASHRVRSVEVKSYGIFYNDENGERITADYEEPTDLVFYQQLVEEMGSKYSLTGQELDAMIKGFESAGFESRPSPADARYHELLHRFSDGSATKILLDKQLQRLVSRQQYAEDGRLASTADLRYENVGGDIKLTGHRFVAFYDSPFTGVRMAIKRVSEIENFNLRKFR